MSKDITYKCDGCGREYEYKIDAMANPNAGSGALLKILNKEYCRQCCKKMVELFDAENANKKSA